ncbi:MAG: hypothetical protein JKY00_06200 [Roseicyclus sp.]|nr:hypothetical protein [Roseicyclus sp.]
MKHLINFSKRAAIAAMISFVALPAAAFNGATDFAPGGNGPDDPGFGGPDGFAAPSGGGGGGGGSAPFSEGEGYIANTASDPCPRGELVVTFDVDPDGHAIPTSFERSCVIYR